MAPADLLLAEALESVGCTTRTGIKLAGKTSLRSIWSFSFKCFTYFRQTAGHLLWFFGSLLVKIALTNIPTATIFLPVSSFICNSPLSNLSLVAVMLDLCFSGRCLHLSESDEYVSLRLSYWLLNCSKILKAFTDEASGASLGAATQACSANSHLAAAAQMPPH